MKYFRIHGIETIFNIENGNIYNLEIENSNFFIEVVNAIFENDNEKLLYMSNNELKDFNKNSLFVYDIFSSEINSKKTISSLYKKINDKIVSNEEKLDLLKINTLSLELLQKIANKLDVCTNFEDEIDIIQFLSLYKFIYEEDNTTLFNKFIDLIKANLEIKDFSFIITINILSLFSDENIRLLKKELEYMNMTLINIEHINRIDKNNDVYRVIIDKDLCEY